MSHINTFLDLKLTVYTNIQQNYSSNNQYIYIYFFLYSCISFWSLCLPTQVFENWLLPGASPWGFRWLHSINIRTPQWLWDEAICQSIFTLRPGSPEGPSYYRMLFILFPAWGWHSQSHLLFMSCSFKFNSAVHYCNLIVYYILF